jgi:hypothetical protein
MRLSDFQCEQVAMQTNGRSGLGRRQFLRTLSAGAVATAATPIVTAAKADNETNDEKRKSRYRATDHVKAFYRVNRYPS